MLDESRAASEENRQYIETLIDTKLSAFKLELEQQRTQTWFKVYWWVMGLIGLAGWTFIVWSLASR